VIDRAELDHWAEHFGVGAMQIERDHFVSHVLAALATLDEGYVCYGGTALCRSYLDGTRLSEDVDLLHPNPGALLDVLAGRLPALLRREFPDTGWRPGDLRDPGRTGWLDPPGITPIRVQILSLGPDTRAWKFKPTDLALRYSDLSATATLECPTLPTFVAMKVSAWYDRHAPRDLYDLAGLARAGAFTSEAENILKASMGVGFVDIEFAGAPKSAREAWEPELSAQVGILTSADDCLGVVGGAISALHRAHNE
jgi:Nucleotidyl transferase AbiEii toxin, Type IV TA system